MDNQGYQTLEQWQNQHKNYFKLNEKNELIFLSPQLNKEHKLGPITHVNLDELEQNFIQNYKALNDQFESVSKIWLDTEDKISIKAEVSKLSHNINKSPVIGDLSAILDFINKAEADIQSIFNNNKIIKEQIIEKAREIADSTDWKETTEKFKLLQEEWKNSPEISKADYELLNPKFQEYKNNFFNKRNEVLESEHLANWDRKAQICEKADVLKDSIDWKSATEEFKQLFDEWKTIGNVTSQEKNEELWNRFNSARQQFFERKNAHSDQIKVEQQDNLEKKNLIIQKAEELAHSTQWKETQEKFEQLQIEWDSVGRVPQELSDETWSRWRNARDTFFEAKKKFNKDYLKNLNDNFEKKQALTIKAEQLSQQNQWRQITEELAQLLEEWKSIGPIPREHGDELWNRFNEARRVFFKRKDEDREKRKHLIEEKNTLRVRQTENFLSVLTKELEDDKTQIEEFKSNLADITGDSKKDLELKSHLENLITQLDRQIIKRVKKIADVQGQLDDLNKDHSEK